MNNSNYKKYFVASISSKGYRSYLDANTKNMDKVIKYVCYPATLTEEIVSEALRKCNNSGYFAEIIMNPLDNTVSGILIPGIKKGFINFAFFDIPEGTSNNKFCSSKNIKKAYGHIKKAYTYLAKALEVHDDWEKIYLSNIDFDKLNDLTLKLTDHILKDNQVKKPSTRVDRFFGAATANGSVDYIQDLTQPLSKRFFIKGRPGTGKSTMLKKLAQEAIDRGFDTQVYHCAFDPDSLDLLIIKELKTCIFDSTSPHEYFPDRESDEIIDVYKIAVQEGTDENNEKELKEIEKKYKDLIARAKEELQLAKEDDNLEQQKVLSSISIEKKIENKEEVLRRLFE